MTQLNASYSYAPFACILEVYFDNFFDRLSGSMLKDEPTLPCILTMVPDLLPRYLLQVWPTTGMSIRQLRLVSKEVGRIALTAVRKCSVDINFLDFPTPEQAVSLFGNARLDSLEVNAIFTVGEF